MIDDLKQIAKTAAIRPIRFFRRARAKRKAADLAGNHNDQVKAIGAALSECLMDELGGQERVLLAAIEKRRTSLLDSKKDIRVLDYGAGSPTSNRTREQMEQGVVGTASLASVTRASKPPFWATLLFKLVRHLKPQSCLELGSCVGISASYQAGALNLNSEGALVTLEGSPEIAAIARETFDELQIKNAAVVAGAFAGTLAGVLEAHGPIDFFFNDGHHDHDAVLTYFNQALPFLAEPAVMVIDDIGWSSGMKKAWRAIQADDHVAASIDLGVVGVALISKSVPEKQRFKIPL